MTNNFSRAHLAKLKREWLVRINALTPPVTIKQFCKKADVNYSTWLYMENPTIRILEKIESTLAKLER